MDRDRLMIAAMAHNALYLVMVIVAGLVSGHGLSWRLGIMALGMTALCYSAQVWRSDQISKVTMALSWGLGVLAGLTLLF